MADALLIPLDARPCTRSFPFRLAQIAGKELLIPPVEFLGDCWKPASLSVLTHWLQENLSNTSKVIVALDTWVMVLPP